MNSTSDTPSSTPACSMALRGLALCALRPIEVWLATGLEGVRRDGAGGADAFSALGYLETSRFSVILSDLSMPQMDGIELIERIRKSPHHRDTPAIAISAFPETYGNAVAAGFNLFIRKPIDIDKVCEAVSQLVKKGDTAKD